jgi:hypothetical protein
MSRLEHEHFQSIASGIEQSLSQNAPSPKDGWHECSLPQYPHLATILGEIGCNCDADGIALHQLRRITFFEEEINIELVDDDGEPMVFSYMIVKSDEAIVEVGQAVGLAEKQPSRRL